MQILSIIFRKLIRFYQIAISPLLGTSKCRFSPTCSKYADKAIKLHGPLKGSWLAVKRIIRCQPLCLGGVDPVSPVEPRPNKD